MTDQEQTFWRSLGIDASITLTDLATKLRQATVSEWLNNPEYYESFLTNISVRDEAPKFLQPGYFHGDLMLTALSNALQAPFIVFSSIACHPIFCVEPTKQVMIQPLFVAYNQSGPGHFDGVVPISEKRPQDLSDPKVSTCSCGKNTKTSDINSCCQKQSKYTTTVRCPCLKKHTL